jgi:hypothetical protein
MAGAGVVCTKTECGKSVPIIRCMRGGGLTVVCLNGSSRASQDESYAWEAKCSAASTAVKAPARGGEVGSSLAALANS